MMKQCIVAIVILSITSVYSVPLTKSSRQENVKLDSPSQDPPPYLLKMEHRGLIDNPFAPVQDLFDKVFSSKTMTAVDGMVSSMVNLAGGVVDDLGDLVVTSIDQLPKAIQDISTTVGDAVDKKRETVMIMVKGVHPAKEDGVATAVAVGEAIDKIEHTVENSQFQNSLSRLEDAFGSFLGKLVGATYSRADEINKAISQGIRRITGAANKTAIEESLKPEVVKTAEYEPAKLPITYPDDELNEV